MNRSICLYQEQQEILYENILSDLAAKFSNPLNLEKIDKKIKKKATNYKTKLKSIEQQLIKANVNVEKIKTIVKKHADLVKQDLKTKDPKKIGKSLALNLKNAFEEVQQELTIPEQIILSIMTLVAVIVVCMFFQVVVLLMCIGLGLPLAVSQLILIIFVAPLVEEYSKFLSVKYNYTGMYFIVFNAVEFFLYIKTYFGVIPLVPLIIVRLLAVGMHAITTYIQYAMRKNAKENKEDPEEAASLGLLIGIIIHFFWNLGLGAIIARTLLGS